MAELDKEEKSEKRKYVWSYGSFETLIDSIKDSQKVVEMLTPSFEWIIGARQSLESLQPAVEAMKSVSINTSSLINAIETINSYQFQNSLQSTRESIQSLASTLNHVRTSYSSVIVPLQLNNLMLNSDDAIEILESSIKDTEEEIEAIPIQQEIEGIVQRHLEEYKKDSEMEALLRPNFLHSTKMERKIRPSLRFFNKKFPKENGKRVFIMIRFPDEDEEEHELLKAIVDTIKETLSENNLQGLIANDIIFDPSSVWENVCVYIFGCDFGIAVLEKLQNNQNLNPNVLFEFGSMMGGLGKPCLLMKEKQIKKLPSDIITIYEKFDGSKIENIRSTGKRAVQNWIDKHLRPCNLLS